MKLSQWYRSGHNRGLEANKKAEGRKRWTGTEENGNEGNGGWRKESIHSPKESLGNASAYLKIEYPNAWK